MSLLTVFFATSLAASTAAPGESCGTVTDMQDTEAATLAECKVAFRSKDEKERMHALERAAALSSRADSPIKEVAQFLARGLKDGSIGVRSRAATLLKTGQHPGESLKALLKAIPDLKKLLTRAGNDRQSPESLAAMRYGKVVLQGLGSLRDDRSAKAIKEIVTALPWSMKQPMGDDAARALLELGSQECVETTIRLLSDLGFYKAGESVHELLIAFARKHEIDEGTPTWSLGNAAEWTQWVKSNKKSIPPRVGKIGSQRGKGP